jgi:hypothetical protein
MANEFDTLFASLINTTPKEVPMEAALQPVVAAPQPIVVQPVAIQPVAQPGVAKSLPVKEEVRRAAVEKKDLSFPGFPFEFNMAVDKGYVNFLFTRMNKGFMYYAQIEKFVRFCQAHGDEFLAYLKSQGVK